MKNKIINNFLVNLFVTSIDTIGKLTDKDWKNMVDDISLNNFEKRMKTTIMSDQFVDKLIKRMKLKYCK